MNSAKIPIKLMTAALTLLTIIATESSALTHEQFQAKIQGIELYNQYKAISAIDFLKTAADGGDDEALYYLGEALRKNNRHMTPEAKKAYESSAKKGNIYSMIRLGRIEDDLCSTMKNCPPGEDSPSSWVIKAKSLAIQRATQGDSESMYLLYEMTGNDDWLEKSAENGFAFAQFRLATKYQEGSGSFLLPSRRNQAIERWMKASAENGYPLAMMGLAAIMIERNDLASFRTWNEKAADSSYVEGVFGYASYIGEENSKYGFAFDPIKSYALLSNLLELNGGGNVVRDVNDTLTGIEKNMSKEQIEKAKELAKTWKANHSPLSFYPDKLGY
ncbi:sel1 repeat family protein [Pseudomonas sp. P108]|uniref:tetratricopeptide repeat protein n=1 Tax=Pseudomonas sp. P108 TaxID=1837993 RepID=UPI002934AE19|nr:sel1 repeat family protein [Pseudomonas sp. P108]WNZ86928.1 sel1 repeat family protein [Pseudomonas sp. P108]